MKSIVKPMAFAAALTLAGGYSALTLGDDWSLPYQQGSASTSGAAEEPNPPGGEEGKVYPKELPDLPDDKWLTENPYRGNPEVVAVGHHLATRLGCEDCHGIDLVSGGIIPDLRELGPKWDTLFLKRIRHGSNRGMPSFGPRLSQEAMWAVRSYIDVRWAQYSNADVEWYKKNEEVFEQYIPDYLKDKSEPKE